MKRRQKTQEQLRRYALLRQKLLKENQNKSDQLKMSLDQIEQMAREAVRMGHVNEHGNIVGVTWDSIQPTNK